MATYESRRYNTPVPDASKIADGSVNNTEFEHLDGVTSDIQTQLTSKLPLAGGTLTGNLSLGDNDEVRIGDGSDLTLAHDGTNSMIQNDTGVLKVSADTVQFKNQADNATFLTINSSSSFLEQNNVYPVGSIYMNILSDNPNTLLGFGTWARFGEGRMLVSQDSGDSDFNTGQETGGAKTVTLSASQIPEHTHSLYVSEYQGGDDAAWSNGASSGRVSGNSIDRQTRTSSANSGKGALITGGSAQELGTSGGSAHDNMPPYIAVYMWKRTA